MKKFNIDFTEFAFLVEACIPPRPIARTMFWHSVIDEHFYNMSDHERTKLFHWICDNHNLKESKDEDAVTFYNRFNPNNQYLVETYYQENNEIHRTFKQKDSNGIERFYTKRNTSILEEYITNITKLDNLEE